MNNILEKLSGMDQDKLLVYHRQKELIYSVHLLNEQKYELHLVAAIVEGRIISPLDCPDSEHQKIIDISSHVNIKKALESQGYFFMKNIKESEA